LKGREALGKTRTCPGTRSVPPDEFAQSTLSYAAAEGIKAKPIRACGSPALICNQAPCVSGKMYLYLISSTAVLSGSSSLGSLNLLIQLRMGLLFSLLIHRVVRLKL
jgi:hypothetical protein